VPPPPPPPPPPAPRLHLWYRRHRHPIRKHLWIKETVYTHVLCAHTSEVIGTAFFLMWAPITGNEHKRVTSNAVLTTHAMYVLRNIQALSCNHCFRGETISITYSVCVFVVFGIQHAMRKCHVVICGLPGSEIFFHIISQRARFFFKKSYWTQKVCFCFSLQLLSETFFILIIQHHMILKMYSCIRVNWPLFSSHCNET